MIRLSCVICHPFLNMKNNQYERRNLKMRDFVIKIGLIIFIFAIFKNDIE